MAPMHAGAYQVSPAFMLLGALLVNSTLWCTRWCSGHVEAGVALPAHRVPPALVVLADGVQQVAVAQRGAVDRASAELIVVKGVAQAPCAAVGPGPGGRVQRDVGEAVGACCVSVGVKKLESDPEYPRISSYEVATADHQ
jgi:hypothetical protein